MFSLATCLFFFLVSFFCFFFFLLWFIKFYLLKEHFICLLKLVGGNLIILRKTH